MSNESLPTTSDTDQTEPITDKEMIRSLVRDEIEAWWTSGRSVDALKRAESKSSVLEDRLRQDWGLPPRSRTLPGSSATAAKSAQDRPTQYRHRLGRRFQVPLPGELTGKSRKTASSAPVSRRLQVLADYQAAVDDLARHALNFDLFDREGLLAEWVANNAARIVGLNETLVGLYGQIGLVVDQQPNVATVGEMEHHERVVVSDAMSVLVTDPSHQHPGPGVEVVGGVGDPVEPFEQGVGDVVDVVSGVEFVPDTAVDENACHETSPSVGGCGDHSVGEQEVPAADSPVAGTFTDEVVDEYARVFLDGASEWWRQDDPHCTPAPMTPAVTSGIRRVLERVEAERAVSALASDGMDESGHVVWRSVAGANVYARPRVVKLHQWFGKFTPGGARRLAAALSAAADVAEGRP
ncbi:hypothetical protein NXT08_22325 [Rhodococcus pyridinivorans]|uniref:hypothetical protein n=1 Tax=Rhodococcus pyridinivorans TaxID=103816 RepID=UPI0021648948|nr:hypothetical protein [Rhodococcus pyridinivorans]UVT24940.1 hypothetical protein NXT08_22325 [Rhodococcus pyridinivorans]